MHCFKYGSPRPYKGIKTKDRAIVVVTVVKLEPTFMLPKELLVGVGQVKTPDLLIMDNLDTSLATKVNKSYSNSIGPIVDTVIKLISSTISG